MSDTSRTALAVALLSSDADLQRLVVTWPQIDPLLRGDAQLNAWARTAGIALSVVRRKAVVLLANELCLPRGEVAQEAQRVVQTLAAEVLRNANRGARR